MIMPLIMSMYGTALANNSAARMFNVMDAQMGLANSVTGSESPAQVARLAQTDKALQFAGIAAKANYEAALAMQDSAAVMMKRDREQRDRMLQNGVVFF